MIILTVYSSPKQSSSPSLLGGHPPKSPKQEIEINDIRKCEIVTVVRAAR